MDEIRATHKLDPLVLDDFARKLADVAVEIGRAGRYAWSLDTTLDEIMMRK